MADDTLKMAAEIVDKWSGPLKEMQKSVRNVSEAAKKYSTENVEGAKKHTSALYLLRREMTDFGRVVKQVTAPALGELTTGFGLLAGAGAAGGGVVAAVAAAIAGVTYAAKMFADRSLAIVPTMRQVKGAVGEQVYAWQLLGNQVGLSTQQMNQGLMNASSLIDQFKRKSPLAFEKLAQMPRLDKLIGIEELSKMQDRSEAIKLGTERIVGSHMDPDMKRRALSLFGMSPELAAYTKDELEKWFKENQEIIKKAGPIDFEKGFGSAQKWSLLGNHIDVAKTKLEEFADVPVAKGLELANEAAETLEKTIDRIRKSVGGAFDKHFGNDPATKPPPPEGDVEIGPLRHPGDRSELEDFRKSVEQGAERGSEKGVFTGLRQYASFVGGDGEPTIRGGGYHRMAVPGGGPKATRTSLSPAKDTPTPSTDAMKEIRKEYSPAPPPTGPLPDAVTKVGGGAPDAFIMHHTGGRGGVADVQNTLRQRGLGVEYVMDREGNITKIGGPGSSHMMTGWGAGKGLSNRNTVGMEVIARDDKDVTPAQVAAAQRFIAEKYPNTPVFGHGEVNPGHKEASEGMSIVNAIRAERAAGGSVRGSMFQDIRTASGRSAITTEGIALPSGGNMGDLYEVTAPDGRKYQVPLIDRGPASRTGRGLDVSRALAERMGYGKNFPTNSRFKVRRLGEPYGPPAPEPGQQASLLDHARDAGVLHKVEGSAHVNINLSGFPRGVKTSTSAEGIFKSARINRGPLGYPTSGEYVDT